MLSTISRLLTCICIVSFTVWTKTDDANLTSVELTAHATQEYSFERLQEIKEMILDQPENLLDKHEQIVAPLKRRNPLTPTFNDTHKYSYPLFLLNECVFEEEDVDNPENNLACPINRLTNPHYRASFEQHIVTALEEAATKNPEKAINYVNVGAGNLFQDLVIITQALAKNISSLNVHIIDPEYYLYVEALKTLYPSQQTFDVSEDYNFQEIIAKIDSYNSERLLRYISIIHERFRQFITWFKTVFSNQQIRIFLYPYADDYYGVCEQKPEMRADVFFQCDPDPNLHQNTDFVLGYTFGVKKGGVIFDLGKELKISIWYKNFDSKLIFSKHCCTDELTEANYYVYMDELTRISPTKKSINLNNEHHVHDEL